ncbi:hypothetical protein BHM03_00061149 [Ensete ventricosum]|nr:hypothetical protein BHM03_00061149 [Ensete ventricosum]
MGCSFDLPLLFSSFPLRNSCEIKLEEFYRRDPSCGYRLRGRLTSFIISIRIGNTGIYDFPRAFHRWLGKLQGAAGYGQGQPAREADDAHKGRQTPAACRQLPAEVIACRGDACGQKHLPVVSP